MRLNELKSAILNDALQLYSNIYKDTEAQKERVLSLIDAFGEKYGADREVFLLSVPGRSEICGNHTDHNCGCAIAGAIDRDIIAIAARNEENTIRLTSVGYYESVVKLSEVKSSENFKKFNSRALIGGVAAGFINCGYRVGGFDAYTTSDVLKGSGLSSSAAFEVMIGNALNHLYNDGKIDGVSLAKIARYAENEYFGKPCGLLDQIAAAVGGFVYIDFENTDEPCVIPIDFSLKGAGYSLCIVNTGGSHSDLNEEYALIPREMKAVANALGASVLREVEEEKLLNALPGLRENLGDRAVLRALHFFAENKRVGEMKDALLRRDMSGVIAASLASGVSSATYLQNVYTPRSVKEQGITLALALANGYINDRLKDKQASLRVHGGGFAGTAQIILPTEEVEAFCEYMDSFFGKGAAMALNVRPIGACRLF